MSVQIDAYKIKCKKILDIRYFLAESGDINTEHQHGTK